MLPPGHIAAGYLTAEALLKFSNPGFSAIQTSHLLFWGMFFGFAPDLDMFYIFFRERSFAVKNSEKNNHRKLLSHAPILWLIAGLLIYFLSVDSYYKIFGLLLWLASWSHFILDSIEDGVMWLWPFSSRQFAFRFPANIVVEDNNFFSYWRKFLVLYAKQRLTFYLEISIIICAVAVCLHH